MKTRYCVSSLVLAPGVLAIALLGGCSASDNGPGGTTGTGGTSGAGGTTATGGGGSGTSGMGGGAGSPAGTALTFDASGYVATSTNTYGVQGAFTANGDDTGAMKCETAGMHMASECSTISMTLDPGAQKVCATGVGATVLGGDYANIYGVAVKLDLNNAGGDGGVAGTYNATMRGVTGIGFTLTSDSTWSGPGEFRVQFIATGQDGTVGQARYKLVPLHTTSFEARFAEATVAFAPTMYPEPTDATSLVSVQWAISTNTAGPTPYNFCLTNIHVLTTN